MSTIFTKIRLGEIPGNFVYRDNLCFAITDIAPIAKGHILLIPNEEVPNYWEADEELLAHLMKVAKKLARAQRKAFNKERVGQLVIGFDVPHLHIHMVPCDSMTEMDPNRKAGLTPEEITESAEAIRNALVS